MGTSRTLTVGEENATHQRTVAKLRETIGPPRLLLAKGGEQRVLETRGLLAVECRYGHPLPLRRRQERLGVQLVSDAELLIDAAQRGQAA